MLNPGFDERRRRAEDRETGRSLYDRLLDRAKLSVLDMQLLAHGIKLGSTPATTGWFSPVEAGHVGWGNANLAARRLERLGYVETYKELLPAPGVPAGEEDVSYRTTEAGVSALQRAFYQEPPGIKSWLAHLYRRSEAGFSYGIYEDELDHPLWRLEQLGLARSHGHGTLAMFDLTLAGRAVHKRMIEDMGGRKKNPGFDERRRRAERSAEDDPEAAARLASMRRRAGEKEPYVRTPPPKSDERMAIHLVHWVRNTEALNRHSDHIRKNLVTKMARGIYDPKKADKLWGYLADAAAQDYARYFHMFGNSYGGITKDTRRHTAMILGRAFEDADPLEEYEHMLPKKYRRKGELKIRKKNPSFDERRRKAAREARALGDEEQRRALERRAREGLTEQELVALIRLRNLARPSGRYRISASLEELNGSPYFRIGWVGLHELRDLQEMGYVRHSGTHGERGDLWSLTEEGRNYVRGASYLSDVQRQLLMLILHQAPYEFVWSNQAMSPDEFPELMGLAVLGLVGNSRDWVAPRHGPTANGWALTTAGRWVAVYLSMQEGK